MEPFSAALVLLILTVFLGVWVLRLPGNIANAKMAAAADRLKNEVMLARRAKFGEASKIGGDLRQITSDELAFGRQSEEHFLNKVLCGS